jgi:hypothetical protein
LKFIRQRKFTILGFLLIAIYGFLIWPYPEHFPILTHSLSGLIVMILFAILMSLDHRKNRVGRNESSSHTTKTYGSVSGGSIKYLKYVCIGSIQNN